MRHVMADLETWGTLPGSHLRSIGAVEFNPETGQLGRRFYQNVAELPAYGLTRDASTEKWWSEQSAEAVAALEPKQAILPVAMQRFAGWFCGLESDPSQIRIWGHGATFDPVLLESAFRAAEIKCPWDHRAARDTRTLFDLVDFDKSTVPPIGTAHNALDDAVWQALAVIECYRLLKVPA